MNADDLERRIWFLGPNGALVYCMEYLEKNYEWLKEKLKVLKNSYLIFDMPGQVELYTHHSSIKNITSQLETDGYHLCAVHMVDSHYCSEATKFVSTLLLSLCTMLHVGLPHVNVLSKVISPMHNSYCNLIDIFRQTCLERTQHNLIST